MKIKDGRRYMYIAHEHGPAAFSIFGVTGPAEPNPVMISSLPTPQDFGSLHKVGGRIGAHNIHENEPEPGSAKRQNTVSTFWSTWAKNL
jgi:hypothetical protein